MEIDSFEVVVVLNVEERERERERTCWLVELTLRGCIVGAMPWCGGKFKTELFLQASIDFWNLVLFVVSFRSCGLYKLLRSLAAQWHEEVCMALRGWVFGIAGDQWRLGQK